MSKINTKHARGRRDVRYGSWEEMLREAEALATSDIVTVGNWTYPQILSHIAMSLNTSIDGAGFSFPRPVQWLMKLLLKQRFLSKPLPPGFKTSKELTASNATTIEEAMHELRTAIARQETEPSRAPHPGFGEITKEEHATFHLRHAELHMSFVVPS